MQTATVEAIEIDEFDAGVTAFENGEDYAFGATPEWQQGFKDRWYRENRRPGSIDLDGIMADQDWEAYLMSL